MLDRGRIIERGTHMQLLAADGAYAQMWMRQQARPDDALASSPDGIDGEAGEGDDKAAAKLPFDLY